LNQAIREVRRISHDLRPSLLDDLGFEAALLSMTDEFSERTGVFTNVRLDLPDIQLPDDIEITIYRVIQEALTNIERHAQATQAGISIYARDDTIKTIVSDNGKGIARERQREGIGLSNMRERTELLGGSFELKSKVGLGTRIISIFSLEPIKEGVNKSCRHSGA
ncbi:MAG: sensor histidine kinase, partial [Pontibacterium sp.]